jgi:hypothetical protein
LVEQRRRSHIQLCQFYFDSDRRWHTVPLRRGPTTQFNGITIQKNRIGYRFYNTNPLILQGDLNILSGALLCANTAFGSTTFTPSVICVGEDISIPDPDLSVGGDVSIGNMAALRLDEDIPIIISMVYPCG